MECRGCLQASVFLPKHSKAFTPNVYKGKAVKSQALCHEQERHLVQKGAVAAWAKNSHCGRTKRLSCEFLGSHGEIKTGRAHGA